MKSSLMLGVNPDTERQKEDFYATHPDALRLFLKKLKEDDVILNKKIWECACGQGHLSRVLEEEGFEVLSTDLIDRGFGRGNIDFLKDNRNFEGDILTNPPFKLAKEFVERGVRTLKVGNKLFLFLKIQFLEGQKRKKLFKKYPLKYIYCYSSRQKCSRDGEFEKYSATTQFYAWFIWEKGYNKEPIVRWI